MPFLRRLLGRLQRHGRPPAGEPVQPAASDSQPIKDLNRLVELPPEQVQNLPVEVVPWSAKRLEGIFGQLQVSLAPQALEDARAARECLTRFWLAAPVDQLELLYGGPIGRVYRSLLTGPLPSQPLVGKEHIWKSALSERLLNGFGSHETTNLLLAVMPYFERNGMRVADPLQQVPQWLLEDYALHNDPELLATLGNRAAASPVALLSPAGSGTAAPPQLGAGGGSGFPALPVLGEKRLDAAMPLIRDSEFLGRMSGLINLYTIDPSDGEVKRELAALRRQVAQIWLDVDSEQLEALYRTPFGQLTQNLIGSGFASVPLSGEEEVALAQLTAVVREMRHPLSLNAVLATLLYYPPTKVSFKGAEALLPRWLIQELTTLHSRAVLR